MGLTKDQLWNEVSVRWGLDDEDGVFRVKGVRVTERVVLAVFEGDLEIHLVRPTETPNEYELLQCFGPLFRVGEEEPKLSGLYDDLHQLSFVEFVKKYPHAELLEYLQEARKQIPGYTDGGIGQGTVLQ